MPDDQDRFPYIELEKLPGNLFDFPWRWRIILKPEDESRGWGSNAGSGIASTRWGALWEAKKAFRKYLKRLDEKNRVERIPL